MKERQKKLILTFLLLDYDNYKAKVYGVPELLELFGNEFLKKILYISPYNKQYKSGHFYFIFDNFTFFVERKKDEINIFEEHESKRCLMIESYSTL